MNPATFSKFRQIVYDRSGIALSPGKEALVSARVGKRMRALGFAAHDQYLDYLLGDDTGEELVHFIDAISTNVTSFFREPAHFNLVGEVMEKWLAAGQTRFRFWSAASSTGEEPYSLAMTLREAVGTRPVDLRILATDISTRVLQKCIDGEYDGAKLDSVPPAWRARYFQRVGGKGDTRHRVVSELKGMIAFRQLNLSAPPFPMKGPLDMVFCRNVMIYFDNTVRKALLDEICRLLKPGGYLMVGHAESLTGMMSSLKSVRPSVYIKS